MARTRSGPQAPLVSSQARTKRATAWRDDSRTRAMCRGSAASCGEPRRQLALEDGELLGGIETQPRFRDAALDPVGVNRRRQRRTQAGREHAAEAVLDLDRPFLVEAHVIAVGDRHPDLHRRRAEIHEVPEGAPLVAARQALDALGDRDLEVASGVRRHGGDRREEALGDVAGEQVAGQRAEALRGGDREIRGRPAGALEPGDQAPGDEREKARDEHRSHRPAQQPHPIADPIACRAGGRERPRRPGSWGI